MQDLIIGVIVMSALTAFCVVVWTISMTIHRTKRDRLRYETQSKLLERFGTSEELLAYLKSDAGQRFLEAAELERTNPYGRILRAITAGVVLACIGWAFLALRGTSVGHDSEFTVMGTLVAALGGGFLLSGGISYALSRSWGLLEARARESGSQE